MKGDPAAGSDSAVVYPFVPNPAFPRRTLSSSEIAFADRMTMRSALVNLDTRLRPFWSTTIGKCRIAVVVYASSATKMGLAKTSAQEPLIRQILKPDAQGQFSLNLTIPWTAIRDRGRDIPKASCCGANSDDEAWFLHVAAELLPEACPSCPGLDDLWIDPIEGTLKRSRSRRLLHSQQAALQGSSSPAGDMPLVANPCYCRYSRGLKPIAHADICVSPSGGVRVISDLVRVPWTAWV